MTVLDEIMAKPPSISQREADALRDLSTALAASDGGLNLVLGGEDGFSAALSLVILAGLEALDHD